MTEVLLRAAGRKRGWQVLPLLVLIQTVAYSFNGVLGPLLPAIARAYRVPVGDAAWLAAASALGWGIAAYRSSALVTRYGSKPMMLLGMAGMAASLLATPVLRSLPAILAVRLAGGLGGGLMGPACNVYIIEYFSSRERGKAFGWATTGFAFGGGLLTPLLVLLANIWGWQGSLVGDGMFVIATVWLAAMFLPGAQRPHEPSAEDRHPPSALGTSSPWVLLLGNFAERSGTAAVVSFWPALLTLRYHLPLGVVALATGALYWLGGLGSVLGGALTSRYKWPEKAMYGASMSLCAVLVAVAFSDPLLTWAIYVVAGCAYSLLDNMARPAYFQMIAGSHANYRSLMAWNAISNQLGGIDGNAVLPLATGMLGFAGLGWEGLMMDGISVIAVGLARVTPPSGSATVGSLRLSK